MAREGSKVHRLTHPPTHPLTPTLTLLSPSTWLLHPHPILNASVFLLHLILYNWPDSFACKILLCLWAAVVPPSSTSPSTSLSSSSSTSASMMLIIADHILPLACVDYFGEEESSVVAVVKGAERMLAPPPLLVNWERWVLMCILWIWLYVSLPTLSLIFTRCVYLGSQMHVTFNMKEWTLCEIIALILSQPGGRLPKWWECRDSCLDIYWLFLLIFQLVLPRS